MFTVPARLLLEEQTLTGAPSTPQARWDGGSVAHQSTAGKRFETLARADRVEDFTPARLSSARLVSLRAG